MTESSASKIARWRWTADLLTRSGLPVGAMLREAADAVEAADRRAAEAEAKAEQLSGELARARGGTQVMTLQFPSPGARPGE